MRYLPFALIVVGYLTLIVTAGVWGLVLAVGHIAIMLVAAHFNGKKDRPPPKP